MKSIDAHLTNEVSILSKLGNQHPNIIKSLDYGTNELYKYSLGEQRKASFIVFELMKNGELFSIIEQEKFSEPLARYFFKQIVKGL